MHVMNRKHESNEQEAAEQTSSSFGPAGKWKLSLYYNLMRILWNVYSINSRWHQILPFCCSSLMHLISFTRFWFHRRSWWIRWFRAAWSRIFPLSRGPNLVPVLVSAPLSRSGQSWTILSLLVFPSTKLHRKFMSSTRKDSLQNNGGNVVTGQISLE